ncbi:MAG: HD domain-containing protein [Candidatus Hydrogenedentes bacterium]|nr:HD domain-containing protein [Candidatus Hydrogenedentota bacterium]
MKFAALSKDAGLIAAAEYARAHDEAPEHGAQVCRLAMRLFEQTAPLHGLSNKDKRILAAAALLHELGWSTRPEAHHKGSRDIILELSLPGFEKEDLSMIASVAGYHRKAHPKKKDKIYRDLNETAQESVRKLAAILRIADGFDRAHAETVKKVKTHWNGKVLTIAVQQEPRSAIDIMGANRKKDLFEEVFGFHVLIRS